MSCRLSVTISPAAVSVGLDPPKIEAKTWAPIQRDPVYNGPVDVTPGAVEQVLPTAGCRISDNIVVNPIPSNYGRIEWNSQWLSII